MATLRGRLALALGGALYVVAWAFGSAPLYPVAVGLVLAVALAWAWVRVLDRPMTLRRAPWGAEHYEGEDVPVNLELTREGRWTPATLPVVDHVVKLGTVDVLLHRTGRGALGGRYVIPAVPRGRYPFGESLAVLEDPFGLERRDVPLPAAGALLVYPRLTALETLFSESGAHAHEGRRLLVRRPSGFDLHSVREYEQGESLRQVHWRSTARRGKLMVKDLEDAPRDEVAVLLDAAAGSVAGEPPDSSFDMQVRAAGSIVAAHARRGRRAVLEISSLLRETQLVRAEDADWHRALELLAAAEPTGETPAALLLGEGGAAARALELTVVTARLTPGLVDRLVQRSLTRRGISLVYVDAPTFGAESAASVEPAAKPPVRASGPVEGGNRGVPLADARAAVRVSGPVEGARGNREVPPADARAALLWLQAAGVPVAVLRRGDDLAAKLGSPRVGVVASG
jgi:uncharacterized protein (DUF58 family)